MRLVYLVFASNTAYLSVVDKKPKDVTISPDTKKWRTNNGVHDQWEKIGEHRYVGDRYGTIGVYDLDKISHANMMVYGATEAVRRNERCDE